MSDERDASPERAADLVLARLHLRLGSLSLARAELETLAGRDILDSEGVIDLAEVRWRTGDIAGAGEAAQLMIDDDEGPVLALIVAAEAAAARGRPTEARRLAAKALAAANGSIDAIFAGMPRSPAWPPDPAAPPPAPTTMFDSTPPGAGRRAATGRASETGRRRPARERAVAPTEELVEPANDAGDGAGDGVGLWDEGLAAEAEAEAEAQAKVDAALPTGEEALEAGRAALEAGDVIDAGVRLALVLRIAPALAPAILDLVGDRHDPALALVRGDAYRLVGRELEARQAYADAARPDDHPPQGDPE